MYHDHLKYRTASTRTTASVIYLYSSTSPLPPWQSTKSRLQRLTLASSYAPSLVSKRTLTWMNLSHPFAIEGEHRDELGFSLWVHFLGWCQGGKGEVLEYSRWLCSCTSWSVRYLRCHDHVNGILYIMSRSGNGMREQESRVCTKIVSTELEGKQQHETITIREKGSGSDEWLMVICPIMDGMGYPDAHWVAGAAQNTEVGKDAWVHWLVIDGSQSCSARFIRVVQIACGRQAVLKDGRGHELWYSEWKCLGLSVLPWGVTDITDSTV